MIDKKTFFNNWDLKSIIIIAQLAVTLGGGFIVYGEYKSDVEYLKAQRDKDVETVKMIRDNDTLIQYLLK